MRTLEEMLRDDKVLGSRDPYVVMAAEYFGVPEDRVTKEQRQKIKELVMWHRYTK